MNLTVLGWLLSLLGLAILSVAFLRAGTIFVEWVDVVVKERSESRLTVCPEKERWR